MKFNERYEYESNEFIELLESFQLKCYNIRSSLICDGKEKLFPIKSVIEQVLLSFSTSDTRKRLIAMDKP